jgi:hypothetical protein
MKKTILLSLVFVACSTSEFALPTGNDGSRYPYVAATREGGLLMSWFEKTDSVNWALNWSEFSDKKWTEAKAITTGKNYFVNWADFPSIYHFSGDTILAHWLQKTGEGSYDYDIKVSISNDRGGEWSEPKTPHRDGVKGEHGFVSFFRDISNDIGLVWLDGRNMVAGDDGHGYGTMNLYQSGFTSTGAMKWEMKIDDSVCECCPTSSKRTENSILIAYRDRSEDEIRNINIVRYADGFWHDPYAVNDDGWKIAGCPVNGPMLATYENNVAIAWYTSPDETPMVNVAFSKDEGASFEAPIRVDLSQPIGRVDIIWLNENEVMTSWIESAEETTNIVSAIVSKDRTVQNARVISKIQPGRVSGYPQMEMVDDKLFFAWTEGGKGGGVKSKWVHISAFR